MLHLIQVALNNPTPFEWCVAHLQAIGWPALVFIVWKASRIFEKLLDHVTSTVTKIDTMATQIDTMGTNHLTHIQTSLENQDGLLKNMDANISLLVDQGGVRRRKNGGKQNG